MLIRLSEVEKQEYCITLGDHLRKLRAIAGLTQDDLENLCGISKERISRIENGAYIMRWSQFVNLIMIFTMNANTKEYLVAVKILTPRLLQALQMKDARVPPDIVVPISESLTKEFNDDFKNVNSLTLKAKEINKKKENENG